MSTSLGLITIAKALASAEEFIGQGKLSWQAVYGRQEKFLWHLPALFKVLPLLPTLQGWARRTAEELNRILTDHGFSIQLNPWPASGNTFGVVAINDFTVAWPLVGQTHEDWGPQILVRGKPAFRLKRSSGVEFFRIPDSRDPLVRIPTSSGDTVCILKQGIPISDFELYTRVAELRTNIQSARTDYYEGVTVPMVNLSLTVSLDWLLGFYAMAGSDRWEVAQAIQEVRFAMNQYGARAKEATALAVRRGMPRYYVMDGPFLLWIERPGLDIPVFVAHVTEDSWADPGDLAHI